MNYPNLLKPVVIWGNVLNCMVCANSLPHFLQGPEGYPADPIITHYANRAKAGAIHYYGSTGMKSRREEALSFYGAANRFYCIGDCTKPATVQKAMRDAFATASQELGPEVCVNASGPPLIMTEHLESLPLPLGIDPKYAKPKTQPKGCHRQSSEKPDNADRM